MNYTPNIPDGWEVAAEQEADKALLATGEIVPYTKSTKSRYGLVAGIELNEEARRLLGVTLVKAAKRELMIPVEWDTALDQIVARVNTCDLPKWAQKHLFFDLEMVLRPKVKP